MLAAAARATARTARVNARSAHSLRGDHAHRAHGHLYERTYGQAPPSAQRPSPDLCDSDPVPSRTQHPSANGAACARPALSLLISEKSVPWRRRTRILCSGRRRAQVLECRPAHARTSTPSGVAGPSSKRHCGKLCAAHHETPLAIDPVACGAARFLKRR
ncbi:hypothetical protein PSPO01_10719 [Paraphaeosphaeria sporulosa]